MGIMNLLIVSGRATRLKNAEGWMSFATILIAIICITIASARLLSGFSKMSKNQVDKAVITRLQASVFSLGLMANLAILAALDFGR